MAEIFISYARQDEAQAKKVAEALRAEGYRTWRDDELPPHRSYAEVIEERLGSADAVLSYGRPMRRSRSGCARRRIRRVTAGS